MDHLDTNSVDCGRKTYTPCVIAQSMRNINVMEQFDQKSFSTAADTAVLPLMTLTFGKVKTARCAASGE